MFTSKWSFELSREWHFSYLVNSCQYRATISIDVLSMSVFDKTWLNILYQFRDVLRLLLIITQCSSLLTSFIRQNMQERVDMIMKVQSITEHFLMRGKQNISILHKITCSLVSLFLLYHMKVVGAYKFSSVSNHISLSFLYTNFILKR